MRSSFRSSARCVLTCALGALAAWLACGEGGSPPPAFALVPLARLADPGPVAGGLSEPAGITTVGHVIATIADETRFAMAAPRREVLVWNHHVEVPRSRRIEISAELTGSLEHAKRLVVFPYLGIWRIWEPLPLIMLEPETSPDGKRRVQVVLEAPISAIYEAATVTLYAYAIDPLALDSIESRTLQIPDAAQLAFAFGVLQPQAGNDPVQFSLDACEADRCEELFSERFDPSAASKAPWQDRSLSLERLAGQTRRFRFRAQRLAETAPFSFPVWGNPTVYVATPRRPEQRNVILLSIDTLRADHLTPYGYPLDTSPFMQTRFGSGGTIFENAVAAATATTPSHMAIFTGLQPSVTGVVDGMRTLSPGFSTLAELARAGGIDTGAITEDGWLGLETGFGRGFDSFSENRSADIMAPEGQVDVTFEQARRWLERNRDRHFFLFLHTYQVHTPYAPPAAYGGLFAEHAGETITKASPPHWVRRRDYDREIRYVDDELRGLFAHLRMLGLDRDTVFIVVSDHGEEFLDHGRFEHGTQNFQEVVHVPLMLAGPGIPRGQRIATPVSHVDLLPTILELLGTPDAPKWRTRSLLPLIEGSAPQGLEERALFSESPDSLGIGADGFVVEVLAPAYSVRRGQQKVVRYRTENGFRYEYYDLGRDPEERHNLFAQRGHEVADLVARLDGYEHASHALRERVEGESGATTGEASIRLDPAQEEKLRALGYLE